MSLPSITPIRKAAARALRVALLPLLAALAACETTIDVPEPEHEPRVALRLTLDNLAYTDSVQHRLFPERVPFVSVSQRLYTLERPEGRRDATLEVRDAAGTVVERYLPLPTRSPDFDYYKGQYRPTLKYQFRPGQEYSVRVEVPGIPTAESRLTLPDEVPVEASLTPLSAGNNGNSTRRARVTVSFDDPGATADYYLATAKIVDSNGRVFGSVRAEEEGDGTVNVSRYRLSSPGSSYDSYPFPDTNANGQRISFTNDVEYYIGVVPGQPTPNYYLEVTLTHLTKDLYLFLNSQRLYEENDGNPFSEPTPLHSNVEPGFGIFGGASDMRYRIRL